MWGGSSVWGRGRGGRWAGHAGGLPGALTPVHEPPVWLLPCSARGVRLRGRQPPPQTPSGSPRPSVGPGTTAHLPLFPANTPLPHAALPCQPSGVLQVSRPGLCCSVLGSRERVSIRVHACAGVCAMHARCQPRANAQGPHPAWGPDTLLRGVGRRGPLWELPPAGEARPQSCTSVYPPSPPGFRWLLGGGPVSVRKITKELTVSVLGHRVQLVKTSPESSRRKEGAWGNSQGVSVCTSVCVCG